MTVPLNLAVAERKAVIILASQKTLPVAVTVISFLDGESLGGRVLDVGIVVIPCILCHLCQLLIDGLFVSKWATMTEAGGPFGLGIAPSSDHDEEHAVQKGP
jgi:sodium/bile acid cotransporter 7